MSDRTHHAYTSVEPQVEGRIQRTNEWATCTLMAGVFAELEPDSRISAVGAARVHGGGGGAAVPLTPIMKLSFGSLCFKPVSRAPLTTK